MSSHVDFGRHSLPAIACGGFLLGVLIHATFPLAAVPAWVYAFALAVIALLWGRRVVVVAMLTLILGLFRHDLTLPRPDDPFMLARGRDVAFTARVSVARQYDDLLTVVSLNGESGHPRGRVTLAHGHGKLEAGQTVRVSCRIEAVVEPGTAETISRNAIFNARNGAFFACKGNISVENVGRAPWWDPRAMLERSRKAITTRIVSIFPGDSGALLAGILYGDRGLSAEASAAFRFAGMTHIIAVSGSNVTIVVACLVPVFLALGYRRRSAILFSILAIFTFVLFTGASASIVRAAIMGSLALFARAVGRKPNAMRLLVIAAAVITLADPWALAFDAGFALSFLATAGLMILARPVSERLRFIPEAFGLREAASTTTAATIATLPYQIHAFGSSTFAGLLTNLVALPFLGATMGFGALGVALGSYVSAVALPAEGLLKFMLAVAYASECAPFLRVSIPMSVTAMGASYTALAYVTYRHHVHQYLSTWIRRAGRLRRHSGSLSSSRLTVK